LELKVRGGKTVAADFALDVSIDTTNIHAESDLAMKAKALGMCEAKLPRDRRRWRDNSDLLTFLAQL
jgi:hypothetical protein